MKMKKLCFVSQWSWCEILEQIPSGLDSKISVHVGIDNMTVEDAVLMHFHPHGENQGRGYGLDPI